MPVNNITVSKLEDQV